MSDLTERLVVAATGPVLTAALALLVVNQLTAWAQRRREAADARDGLATELTETANSLYLALQAFWRAAPTSEFTPAQRSTSPALRGQRDELARTYQTARAKGQVLEQRLKIYFKSSEPAKCWHRVTDLLAVRYFLLLEGDKDRRAYIRRFNAGDDHTGLTEEQLKDPRLLMATYRQALAETIPTLWNHKLDRRGKHLKGTTAVSTWHGIPHEFLHGEIEDPASRQAEVPRGR